MKMMILICIAVAFCALSCSRSETDKIAEAQYCIDKAERTSVADCIQKIEGIETSAAYRLRCGADFIAQGFDDPNKVASAFTTLSSNSGGGSDPMLGMMALLTFSSSAAADQAVTDCAKSGSSIMSQLSRVAKMATSISNLNPAIATAISSGQTPTQAQMQAAAQALQALPANDPTRIAALTSIGQSVIDTKNSCGTGTTTADKDLCAKLNEAGTTSQDPAVIGNCLNYLLLGQTLPVGC